MAREATIQLVNTIEPLENSDFLSKATVLGWQVVTKRGEFKKGDPCIFVEIDSVLPEKPEYEFMRSRNFRVKTIKIRGCLSQGLLLPVSILPIDSYSEGDDVSDLLGITHYEKPTPVQLMGKCRSTFPTYIVPKTDETRLQSMPHVLNKLQNVLCYSSLKIDGTSFTAIHHHGTTHICSRNQSYKLDENNDNLYIQIANKYNLIYPLKNIENYAIQGEIAGPGIQSNRLNLKEPELFVFAVYDTVMQEYLDLRSMSDFCNRLNLKTVPIKSVFTLDNDYTQAKFLEEAKGNYEGTNNKCEGIVVRPCKTLSRAEKGMLSFKVLNNDYLLTEED